MGAFHPVLSLREGELREGNGRGLRTQCSAHAPQPLRPQGLPACPRSSRLGLHLRPARGLPHARNSRRAEQSRRAAPNIPTHSCKTAPILRTT